MFHLQKILKSWYLKNSVALKRLSVDGGSTHASMLCSQFSASTPQHGLARYCNTRAPQSNGEVDEATGQGLQEATQLINDMRVSGKQVPYQISDADFEYFASLTSKKQRKRFISFLYRKESLKLKDKQKRLEKQEQQEKQTETVEYGPLPNRLILKVLPKNILEFDNWKICQGMKFGQNLVFDFSYDQYMRRPDAISLSTQMSLVINVNKNAKESFHVHFVNHIEGSLTQKELVRITTEDAYNKMLVSMGSESLLDKFSKDELIYLSPDSPNIMKTFDHTKTYVIGALVDGHRIEKGVSLGMAKKLGIAHVRLPIDFYLQWGSGAAKDLTLDQVAKILATMKETNNWKEALKHVPTRKHKGIKTPPKFLNKAHDARHGKETDEDEFVFSRAKPRNKSDHDKLDFKGAFSDYKTNQAKAVKNKWAQKKQRNNFWEE